MTSITTKARECAIVRSGSEAEVSRLLAVGARLVGRGASISVLALTDGGSRMVSEATLPAAWALVRMPAGRAVLVVLADGAEAEREGGAA